MFGRKLCQKLCLRWAAPRNTDRFQTQLFSPESTNFFMCFGVGVDKSCVSCPNRHIGLYRPAPPRSTQLRVIGGAVLLASLVDIARDFSVLCAWVCFGVFLEARSSLSLLSPRRRQLRPATRLCVLGSPPEEGWQNEGVCARVNGRVWTGLCVAHTARCAPSVGIFAALLAADVLLFRCDTSYRAGTA